MKRGLYLFILVQILISACTKTITEGEKVELPPMDLEQIKMRGKIVAVTDYNSANYFIYKGRPMGYQYELLEDFADHIGLQLELRVEDNTDEKIEMLENHACDIVALNMAVTQESKQDLTLTNPHSVTRQILVQRKGKGQDIGYLTNQVDLAGKTVYVEKNSAYALRMKNLASEIGDTIYIREVDEDAETLIQWVSSGKIDYTVCYENIALISRIKHNNVDISIPVSFDQNLAWVVRSDSPELLAFINNWLENYKSTTKYRVLYRRYFVSGNLEQIAKSEFSTFGEGKMSMFDQAIKKYSEHIGWDWKMLASLIYQESRFKPQAKSWAGAFGLMQLMPRTGRKFGVNESSSPEDQILAGVKFLKWLDKRYEEEIPDMDERIKFILASYNVGFGHVQDARRLAKKNGMDPNIWKDSVEFFLLNKSKPEFYNDSVVKYGYCRGTETFKYVNEIIERYQHYSNLYVEN